MPEELNVAAELAGMRGESREALARIDGRIELILHRQTAGQNHLNSLDTKVDALEARRVPLAPLAALSGVMSAAVATLAFLVQPK